MKKDFVPLIKPTTLRDKEVDIKDTMNFDRRTSLQKKQEEKEAKQIVEEDRITEEERRKTTMKTQKMSLDVLLKLDILDPFLRSAENINHDGKISINDKIDILIESYIHSKLATRQLEGFKAIYDAYVGE